MDAAEFVFRFQSRCRAPVTGTSRLSALNLKRDFCATFFGLNAGSGLALQIKRMAASGRKRRPVQGRRMSANRKRSTFAASPLSAPFLSFVSTAEKARSPPFSDLHSHSNEGQLSGSDRQTSNDRIGNPFRSPMVTPISFDPGFPLNQTHTRSRAPSGWFPVWSGWFRSCGGAGKCGGRWSGRKVPSPCRGPVPEAGRG